METTERIVEAYVRYVLGRATFANIRCAGQNEIDLLAIDPVSLQRAHIEVSISVSQGFSKLTGKPFDEEKLKQRVHAPSQRRTVGFFQHRKFSAPGVVQRLSEYGFEGDNYTRVIVTWGWDDDAADQANAAGIELWDFRSIMEDLANLTRGSSQYFADDTLRTLNLFILANKEADLSGSHGRSQQFRSQRVEAERFWVYDNHVNQYAAVHRHTCKFCADGRGFFGKGSTESGQWIGPFSDIGSARRSAKGTGRRETRLCGICRPDGAANRSIRSV